MARFRYLAKNKISSLPKSAGVYVFKRRRENFYIGKATNIRERVKNHFQTPAFRDKLFIQDVKKIGYFKTDSEIEALILEANLIKKYQPKFNVLWRDDKNYFYVGITKEDFPRIFITHQPKNLKSQILNLKSNYIGPFVDGGVLKQTLKILRKVFPYRTCKKIPKKPCLWYQLERCPAPCLLKSKTAKQIPKLREKIKKESKVNVRNLIKILKGKKTQALNDLKREMKKFSKSREYEMAAKIRDQIKALENVFQHANIFLWAENTVIRKPWLSYYVNWKEMEKELRKILRIKRKIFRIEGYDISNIQGKGATGSMVVFENGEPNKKEYRKFKIKVATEPNDIAMLKEVLSRRLNHPEWKFPQIILIDGGIAQLNAARSRFKIKDLRFKKIKVMALAKKKNELYLENRKKPILLKDIPQPIANLILHIRDEAHRFAITYHKKLRRKTFINQLR